MFKNLERHYSVPVGMYILASYAFLPFRTIVIGERPYSTDIHPVISSAMSYDCAKSKATPSTIGVARDVSHNTDLGYAEVEEWFRNSWMFANSGTLVVNCTVFESFSSSRSLSEVIPFQKWLRCILDCSIACGDEKIDVICMGVPATNVTDTVIRSMGKSRNYISKKSYPNPAIVSKGSRGDGASQIRTFDKPGTSKAIAKALNRSRAYTPLTTSDYISIVQRRMAAQVPQVAELVNASSQLVSAVEDAYSELQTSTHLPRLRECHDAFTEALLMYRDMVLRDVLTNATASKSESNSSKLGKHPEWGGKKPWQKAGTSVGASSRMAEVPEEKDGVEQEFADMPPGKPVMDEPEAASTPAPVKTKRVVKRRVVKKRPTSIEPPGTPAGSEDVATGGTEADQGLSGTTTGSDVDATQESVLRTVQYYVSDSFPEKGERLTNMIRATMENRHVTDDLIGAILDTAAMDLRTKNIGCSASLGMEDGEVSEVAMLPKIVERVVEKTA